MENTLFTQQCEVCHSGATRVSDEDLQEYLTEIPDWIVFVKNNVMVLERKYLFKNYKQAWLFTNKVSELAENEFHHPAIILEWGKVTVTWWTHAIKGLHMNDLICAAKTDRIV